MPGTGTPEDPWTLSTPPRTAQYTMHRDDSVDPPVLVCTVGSTVLRYDARVPRTCTPGCSPRGTGSRSAAPTSRRRPHPGRSRHGLATRATRWAGGTGCARATGAGWGCTCRRCWRSWGWRRSSTTRATTGCGPSAEPADQVSRPSRHCRAATSSAFAVRTPGVRQPHARRHGREVAAGRGAVEVVAVQLLAPRRHHPGEGGAALARVGEVAVPGAPGQPVPERDDVLRPRRLGGAGDRVGHLGAVPAGRVEPGDVLGVGPAPGREAVEDPQRVGQGPRQCARPDLGQGVHAHVGHRPGQPLPGNRVLRRAEHQRRGARRHGVGLLGAVDLGPPLRHVRGHDRPVVARQRFGHDRPPRGPRGQGGRSGRRLRRKGRS